MSDKNSLLGPAPRSGEAAPISEDEVDLLKVIKNLKQGNKQLGGHILSMCGFLHGLFDFHSRLKRL